MAIEVALAGIIDANANRAREGIRTAEDYVRFLVGDLQQAARLKMQRQSLTEILRSMPGTEASMMQSRNVTGDPMQPENWKDVLRRIEKETPRDVALRGLKRAQEALRVIEENLRGSEPECAERVARLRYIAYESEQWIACAGAAMMTLLGARVYVLITSKLCRNGDPITAAKAVLKGGIKALQLREKELPDAEYLQLARQIRGLCREAGAVFFCNDRVDLALLAGADGVHLGQGDLSLSEARKLSGNRLLLGRSTHTAAQAKQAVDQEHADCIGIGAMFETATKDKPKIGGVKLAGEISALKLEVPVFAIGGITLDRLQSLKAAGVSRVALTQAVLGAGDVEAQARRFVEAMEA